MNKDEGMFYGGLVAFVIGFTGLSIYLNSSILWIVFGIFFLILAGMFVGNLIDKQKRESSCICFKQGEEKIFSVIHCNCGNYHICEGIVKESGEGDLTILDTFKNKEDAIKYFNNLK